jgi:autotransporter-associated beta strand protein
MNIVLRFYDRMVSLGESPMTGRNVGPSIGGKGRCAFQSKRLLLLLLAGTCLSPVMGSPPVRAQTVWRATPDSGVFTQASNWSAGVPTSVTPGAFNTSNITNLNFADATVSSLIFNSGASAFTFTLTNATAEITGAGVVNNAASHPTFVLNGNTIGGNLTLDSGTFANSTLTLNGNSTLTLGASGGSAAPTLGTATVTSTGLISFNSAGTAGNAVINNNTFGEIDFNDSSTAGSATIHNNNGFVFFQASSSAGNATITNSGSVSFVENSTAGNATIVNSAGGFLLSFTDSATAGNATITTGNGSQTQFRGTSTAANAQLTVNAGGSLAFAVSSTAGNATINATNAFITFEDNSTAGTAAITANGTGSVDFSGTIGPNSDNQISAGSIAGSTTFFLGGNQLTVGSTNLSTTVSGTIEDGGSFGGSGASLVKIGTGTLTLSGVNTYSGGTTINGGAIAVSADNNLGAASGGLTLGGGTLQTTGTFTSARAVTLNAGGGTFNTNAGTALTLTNAVSGSGGLTKAGGGTLTLLAASTYSGGTTVNAGTLQLGPGGSLAAGSALAINGGTFNLNGNNQTVGTISGSGGGIVLGNGTLTMGDGSNTTLAAVISGTGGVIKQGGGILNLTGANTYTGPTSVMAGTLAVNGSLAGNVTVGSAGTLGGNGTIAGVVTNNGTIAPGNSIGLLTVNGSFVQSAGSIYQVELNAAGQNDRINVTGAPGTAVIQGGTVQVLAAGGTYGKSTTYTILNASGGVSGAYAGVTSNLAFLTPTLSYDANDVFLTLALSQNAFTPSFLSLTPNQKAVGVSLNQSFANASGDFATVLGVIAGLNTLQGPLALNTISGEPYADFGTMNTNNAAMFMNALGQQMANARGASAAGQRQALAQACEVENCDAVGPLSAWASALGGLGSVLGDGNASTLTYNFGGAAVGMDYRFDPRFLAGVGVGYTHGTQWVNSFMGQGWSDSVSVAAYGSFTQAGFYVDALAGYAYYSNQLQRQILIPGLQQRTATGSTGANQFLGQIEGGYKLGIYAPASATITPFGRFQISSVTQNGFSESGAQSLNLNVAQQTTNSQRTTIGADLGSSIGLGSERKLDLAVRLGWLHEFADVARPITAAFAGAPGNSFTVFGATPLRNAAVVGLQATTTIAAATQIYLRYDGEIATGTDNHAINVGLRMSW